MRNTLFSLTALIGLAAAAPAMAHPIATAPAPLVQTVDWRGYGYDRPYGGWHEHDRYREWRPPRSLRALAPPPGLPPRLPCLLSRLVALQNGGARRRPPRSN